MNRCGSVLGIAALALGFAGSSAAEARDLFESDDGAFRLELGTAFKGTWLLAFPAADDVAGAALFRLRLDLRARLGDHVSTAIAYQHSAMAVSGEAAGAGFLPPSASAPFRLQSLEWTIIDELPTYRHSHDFDRGYVALHFDFMELTVGRQAIGLGRGMFFSAVDLFAPFSPTEVDQEWRRGVDAAHLELRIPGVSTVSADLIAVLGPLVGGELDSWALLGRVRALVGDVDLMLSGGRRDRDAFGSFVASANLGDAEIHGEVAVFATDGIGIGDGLFGSSSVVAKALLGSSYVFDVHRGLTLGLEYHYSGFGVENLSQSPELLFEPAWQERFLRGDSQLVGRHAIALALSAELSDALSASVGYIQSPVDGSGLISPTFIWDHSESVSLYLNMFVPWGGTTVDGIPTSEWGSVPISVLLQARFYD